MRDRDLIPLFVTALSAATLLPACSANSASGPCGSDTPVTATVPLASVAAVEADAGYFRDGGAAPEAGDRLYFQCQTLCPDQRQDCSVASVEGDQATITCYYDCTGRRPAGYSPPTASEPTTLGAHFARIAELEAASVVAFRSLAQELAIHRAPLALVRACRRAARDEIRHARATGALARAHGAPFSPGKVEPRVPRSIEGLALENAVEGCVRETFGALVAHWQAREARDPSVRATMKRIARDETRHAALSWSIDAWARTRLDRDARARLDSARERAAHALVTTDAPRASVPFAEAAGLPSSAEGRALAASLAGTLFGLELAA